MLVIRDCTKFFATSGHPSLKIGVGGAVDMIRREMLAESEMLFV